MREAVGQALVDTSHAGTWRLYARPRRGVRQEISEIRGIPVLPDQISFDDPFGPKDMSLPIPQISIHDRFGVGDLAWLQKKASIDLIWDGPLPVNYPFGSFRGQLRNDFRWEGYLDSFSLEEGTLKLTCKGAMLQTDDYLAKPEFLRRPLPYEQAIRRQFLAKPHLRLAPMHIDWPGWWDQTYKKPPKGTPGYLIPVGLHDGDNWTGMVTRSTGTWEPTLTSYIQTLLTAMYTRHGRWTIDLFPGRLPVLLHRQLLPNPDASTVLLDITSDAVQVDELEMDWSQAMDVVFGQGQSLSGVTFSGMQVSNDGRRTFYIPLAAARQAYPATKSNPWLDRSAMPREVLLQVLPGLDQYEAEKVARSHLERFGDPGVTGSVTVTGDVPLAGGGKIPHHLCRAGMTVNLQGLLGLRNGLMASVSSSSTSPADGNTKLTFDSRFRDALTVDEVRLRGRDSLSLSRMLIGGQYNPPLPDMLLPWNYKEGSGMIPYSKKTIEFFNTMPDDVLFPWTSWTKKHPPKGHFHDAYMEVGPASRDSNKNWGGIPHEGSVKGLLFGYPVKMAQAGQIRLFQIAAYDRDGNVMKVPFHVSFYYNVGAGVQSMPIVPPYNTNKKSDNYYPYKHQPYTRYAANHNIYEHYPFVKNAWESYNTDGTQKSTEIPQPVHSAGLVPGFVWGTDKIKAGYYPHDLATGKTKPTGLLVDETVRSFDCTTAQTFNIYSPKANYGHKDVGFIYAMVYCDAQGTKPVFFLGRMFRAEPSSQGPMG